MKIYYNHADIPEGYVTIGRGPVRPVVMVDSEAHRSWMLDQEYDKVECAAIKEESIRMLEKAFGDKVQRKEKP